MMNTIKVLSLFLVAGHALVVPLAPPRMLTANECCTLHEDGFVIVSKYCGRADAAALRADAISLRDLRYDTAAGIHAQGTKDTSIRVCTHIWLEKTSDGFTPLIRNEADRAARDYISAFTATLQGSVTGMSPYHDTTHSEDPNDYEGKSIHPEETELAYLLYQPGGLYRSHIDTPSSPRPSVSLIPGPRKHRRAFSFLLYLNEDWAESDGGQLRLFPPLPLEEQHRRARGGGGGGGGGLQPDDEGMKDHEEGRAWTDVLPEAGTLVVFKSEALPHEVRITRRAREAVVGWLHGGIPA